MTKALTIKREWPVAYYCGVAFICYAAVSLLWASGNKVEVFSFLLSIVLSFLLGYFLQSLQGIWIGFSVFLCLNVLLVILYKLDLTPWGWSLPWGIYGNPNLLGCTLAIGLASALAYRLWIFIPPPAIGLWLTQSRGAILGASAALFLWTWPRSRFWAIILLNLGVLAVFLSSHNQAEGIFVRLGIWQDTLSHLTVLGSGLGSFYDAYWTWPVHRNVGFERAGHTYNDFLELTFELGFGAIFLWFFLIKVMSDSRNEVKLVVWTYLAVALTFYALWVPPIGQLVALSLGHMTRRG